MLDINFDESDYSIEEGSPVTNIMNLQFKTNKNSFTVILSSVTIGIYSRE